MKINKMFFLVVMSLVLFVFAQSALGDIVINEVMYNPLGADSYDEWIEIYNNGDLEEDLSAYDLCGETLSEGYIDQETGLTNLESGLTIGPGQYALITDGNSGTDVYVNFNVDPAALALHVDAATLCGELNNEEDTIILNDGADYSDTLTYSNSWGGDSNGNALEKINPMSDDNSAENWRESVLGGTPGSDNNEIPVAEDVNFNTDEDTEVIVRLNYSDADGNDSAQTCSVDNVVSGTVTQACACTEGDCTVGLTPVQDSVLDVTAEYTVNDGNEESNIAAITITVNQVNDQPTLVIANTNVDEDSGITIYDLRDFADDLEDLDESLTFSLDSQSNTSMISCALDPNGHNLNCITIANQTGENTLQISVTDLNGSSATDDFTITVNPVNDLPVIGTLTDQEAIEDMAFSYLITVTDIDSNQGELQISAENSDLVWLSVDSNNGLLLKGTPDEDDVGLNIISVVVSDGNGFSEVKEFNVTVKPALEILRNTMRIIVEGEEYNLSQAPINVTPGDEVSIRFNYKNNLDSAIGYVNINTEPEDLVSYSDSDWILSANSIVSAEEIEFDVYDIEDFNLEIILTGVGIFESYIDSLSIDFNVIRNSQDLIVSALSLADDKLTCTRITDLTVDLYNIGENSIVPELVITNRKVTETALSDEELVFFFATTSELYFSYYHDIEIPADEEEQIEFTVDLSELNGEQVLYVYAVNPHFEDRYSDYETVNVSVGGECLNITSLEEFFSSEKGKISSLGIEDLTEEILEDHQTDYNFVFDVISNTNENMISCQTEDINHEIDCTILDDNNYGQSEITLNIKETNNCYFDEDDDGEEIEVCSEIEESFTIDILPTIEIESVSVSGNGRTIDEVGETLKINPFDTITADFKIKNYLPEKIHQIEAVLFDANNSDVYDFDFTRQYNLTKLEGNEITDTVSLSEIVPYNVPVGKYMVAIKVDGLYVRDDQIKEDYFNFFIEVEAGSNRVELSDVQWQEGNMNSTYCAQDVSLNIDYANGGEFAEDDIIIRVKDETGNVLYDSYTATSNNYLELEANSPNDQKTLTASFNTTELSVGEHTLTVELTYQSESDSAVPKTITVNKLGCLQVSQGNLTLTEDDSVGLGLNLNDFLVKEDDDVQFALTNSPGSNQDLITCSLGTDGSLECNPPKDVAQALNVGRSNTSQLNVTVTAADGTENKLTLAVIVDGLNDLPAITRTSLEFAESDYYEINLTEVVSDIDNELQSLTFTENSENILSITATTAGKLRITPKDNSWNTDELADNVERFNLTVSDGINQTTAEVTIEVSDDKVDPATISAKHPAEDSISILDNIDLRMNVSINNPDNINTRINWSVNDVVVSSGTSFVFNQGTAATYTVKATLINSDSNQSLDTVTWTITVNDVPTSSNFQTNIPQEHTAQEIASFENFTIWNSYGKIVFNDNVDLSEIVNLNDVIIISDGMAAVDSVNASGLNVPATITLKKTFNKHLIKKSAGFNDDNYYACPEDVCRAISNIDGEFIFTVSEFSSYKVVEKLSADIEIAEIFLNNIERGKNQSVNVKILNTGTIDTLTNLKAELVGVNSKYNASITQPQPTLSSGKETNVTLRLTIPNNEDSGRHSLGTLRVSGTDGNGTSVNKTTAIYVNPLNYLAIESIKVNGKSSGDLSLEEINEIEVKVKNDYNGEMTDILVTVKILDVDDDDLEEESDDFDLDGNDDERVTLEFDLSGENVDQKKYTLEVTVEGEAEDDSKHEITETKEVGVERETHKVIIKKTSLSQNSVKCQRYNYAEVRIENVGEKNEDDVEIKLISTGLGLDESKTGIEIDKFSSKDNDYTTKFYLSDDLEEAPEGTYPITIELYRDGDLEESTELSLQVNDCFTAQSSTKNQNQLAADKFAEQMKDNIQKNLLTQQTQQQKSVVKTSFRDSKTYTLLLGILIVLGFITLILAMAVFVKRR